MLGVNVMERVLCSVCVRESAYRWCECEVKLSDFNGREKCGFCPYFVI